jgi:hypothetical protein
MISFRFHIVSITAVFLAIAIGVIVGTTYVDRAVVDTLETRVDRVSKNLDARQAEIDDLSDQVHDLRGYAGASAPFAVSGRLHDVPLVLVAVRGVSSDAANQTVALARKAGASVPGVAWLEEKWTLSDAADHDALAAAAGVSAQGSNARVRSSALAALVAALGPQLPGTDAGLAPQLLDRMVQAGFLTVDPQGNGAPSLGSKAGRSPRLLLVTGTNAAPALATVAVQLARTGVGDHLPAVVADAFVQHDDGPKRAATLHDLVDDDLSKQLAVVDDLELPEGQAASLLALATPEASRNQHYGYGSGADGILPAWSAP